MNLMKKKEKKHSPAIVIIMVEDMIMPPKTSTKIADILDLKTKLKIDNKIVLINFDDFLVDF